MNPESEKEAVRRAMRAERRAVSAEERERACAEVRALVAVRVTEGPVAAYLASADEISLDGAILDLIARGISVAAPRWNGSGYSLARVKGLGAEDLRTGPTGIREPADDDPVAPRAVRVWLVPGLAFTRGGARVGYGGGWYDRMLADADGASERLGVAYRFQIADTLPSAPHDVRLTDVLAPSGDGAAENINERK